MQEIDSMYPEDKNECYKLVQAQLKSMLENETHVLPNLSNTSALLNMALKNINWAGFYLYKANELVLGPFQGKPACIRIQLGKGVCGTAAEARKIQVVSDVNEFPGHIACDAASQSEIVVPIIKDGRLIGVLDIDSPIKNRFDFEVAEGLDEFVNILNKYLYWPEKF
jgi:GAF domain-containing protein